MLTALSAWGKKQEPSGVGIVFTEAEDGSLVVSRLVPGGPAEETGQVAVGDVLYEVEGENVYRADKQKIARKVLGSEGTMVRLGFKRGLRYEADPVFRVMIGRKAIPNAGVVERVVVAQSKAG
mmetsp:Transcript_7571/g.11994  ORF Transcript_7571/g.11994 Transcript_7571/m.11994 type:complete len:123 (+) Transcript_7571:938-1306(+)